ncbi:MAG: type III-B CRISPR module RAMP protein Cmr6 [Bacteroidales bacterium]|nr:type III-B CRISPR module RAMP protein Cmr6 [Bacteroidales bacterium]
MRNLHKYYYKDYFRNLDFSYLLETDAKAPDSVKNEIKRRNSVLTGDEYAQNPRQAHSPLRQEAKIINEVSPADERFTLQISYPGLVTGIGINHEAKIEGEFKLGVHFDWTHGMPVVYGSSVKGVLRSWFMDVYETSDKKYYECGIDAGDLMMNIFEGAYDRDIDAEKKRYGKDWEDKVTDPGKRIYKSHESIYKRDIFFDAVIVKADKKGRILASDSITPHGGENHDNPLLNPKPITFMKIASGCTMELRFKLMPSDINGKTFTAAQKKTLFEEILKTVGVGAKTNVGYGQLK